MPINCQFNLRQSALVYYTGEQIGGSLILNVTSGKRKLKNKPIPVEAIKISLCGVSTIHWSESTQNPPSIIHNDSSVHIFNAEDNLNYTAVKEHLNETQQLTGALELLPGSTQLGSFVFELPSSLPATCQLPHGSINYTLQVSLERRGKHVKTFKQRLIVRNCIEFYQLRPSVVSSSWGTLSLPRSVFVPGQEVAYSLSTMQQNNAVRLCQCIVYQSQEPEAKIKRMVRVLTESHQREGALHLPLTAPVMSTEEDEHQLINISYFVEARSACLELMTLGIGVGNVAPPTMVAESPSQSLCFVNLAATSLTQNELLGTPINVTLTPSAHSCSREINALALSKKNKHNERLKLLQRQQKQSYLKLVLRYFHKGLLP